jgi:hypothetical protein
VHVVEIVEMDDEELYVPDDVLEEASAAGTKCCLNNQNYVIRKIAKINTIMREWKSVRERQ